nr:meiotic recombination protein SPO11 [Phaffia rhodozyma]
MIGRSTTRMPKEWKQELACMLHLRCKAEIQLLTAPPVSHSGVASSSERSTDHSACRDIWSTPVHENSTNFAGQQEHVHRRTGGINRLVAYLQERLDELGPVECEG